MTTPERLKRRQLIEGACLILIGVLMLAQSFWFHHVDADQRSCVEANFAKLSRALDARAGIQARETEQNRRLWGVYAEAAGLVKDPEHPRLDKKDRARLNGELVKRLLDYQKTMADIQRDRREHPVPPYPPGTCGG